MAKTNSTDKNFVCCMKCSHGIFMQWFSNPIVAFCTCKHERMVAESMRICPNFKPSPNPAPEIVHFNSYEEDQILPVIQADRHNSTS